MIAVTGATGALGSRVARLLTESDQDLRLLVRDASRVPAALSGAQVALIGDYTDEAGLRTALAGCEAMLLMSARESVNRVREHRTVLDAAVACGISKIVYISFQGAAPEATFTFARDHWHTEQLIRASGRTFVFLRDGLYLAGLAAMAGADGVIRGPAADGRVAGVSHDDVAAVAARVLTDGSWDNQTLDVTGPEALTLTQVAERLSQVSGRSVTYVVETEEEAYASRAHLGAPSFEVTGWVTSYQAIANGDLADVADTVARVTGREPHDLERFLMTNPTSWAHLVHRSS